MQDIQQAGNVQLFSFRKTKDLGLLKYICIDTDVSQNENTISIQQKITRFSFFKKNPTTVKIDISEIRNAEVKTTFDLWDSIYTIAFIICSFFNPVFLIIAAICAWCAYGKKVFIHLKNGFDIKIPTKGGKSSADFVEYINSLTV